LPASTSVPGADDEVGVDAVHRVGVAGLAQRHDAPVADADVGLDDPPVVEDDGAGDDQVGGALRSGRPALPHRLADDLPAAEDRLLTGPPGAPERSSVTSMIRSVSASRTRSPVVGP
jgi:hypothetical protein